MVELVETVNGIDEKFEKLENFLSEKGIFHRKDHVLKYDTYFKMGGTVKFLIEPKKTEEFKVLTQYLVNVDLDYKIIGATSNVLLFDDVVYSIIVTTRNLAGLSINNNIVSVDAGYSLEQFVRVMVTCQCCGFEGLEGIPGSIGGAVVMNAGAYGHTISDNLITVECLNKNGHLITLPKDDCEFVYRNSIFKNGNYIILRARFKMNKGDKDVIAQRIERYHIARHSYQEFVYPSLGSMISIGSNIYGEVVKNDRLYSFFYRLLKLIYKNPITKFIKRKKPESIVFNKLLLSYVNKCQRGNISYIPSVKSANILVNNGVHTITDLIEYMYLMYDLLGRKYHTENELITKPVYAIKKEFEEEFRKILLVSQISK